jgi:hypothetical protein
MDVQSEQIVPCGSQKLLSQVRKTVPLINEKNVVEGE